MKLDINYNGDCIQVMKTLSDASVDLIIADPPYWKVVGEKWDYLWRTENDYIQWTLEWMTEAARLLRLGGSFYCFGYFRTLAYLIPHLESLGLELRQQIVIDKGMKSVSGRATKNYKMFPNVTESILFIIKDNKKFIKPFLKRRQEELGLSAKEINERLGVKSNGGGMWSIYTGKNICEQFPTEESWNKLARVLEFNMPYSKLAQTFNPQMGFTDVWTDIDFYSEKRYHPTQKPLKLIRRLVSASSNEGDVVLDPFAGAGSTQISCLQLHRHYIGIELDKDYFNTAERRLSDERQFMFYDIV
jgi:DNA modification methylase